MKTKSQSVQSIIRKGLAPLFGILMILVSVPGLRAQGTLSITTASLPAGVVGAPYSQSLGATGGTMPYMWAVTGALPAGLMRSPGSATISGTPTTAGTTSLTVTVTDSGSPVQTATGPVSIVINPPALLITTNSPLPAATVGTPYSTTLAASGGTLPYTWSAVSGNLPAGLTRSAAGVISGTPTTAGSPTFTVRVTDSGSPAQTNQKAFTISVTVPALTVTTNSLPDGTVGASYSQSLTASGGTPPYTWSLASGTLPPGLTRSGATISGTPTTVGTSNFTVRVTDNASPAQTSQKALSITISVPPLRVTTSSLADGTVGTAYSQSVAATGGTPPYTWSIVSGALPAGLTRSGATISGTPTTAGTSNFRVRVADSGSQNDEQDLSITIDPSPLNITTSSFPAATVGVPYAQTLGASGGTPPYSWSISAGNLPAGLTLSGTNITGTPTAAGTSNFTVRVADNGSQADEQALSITVNLPPLAVATATLATGTVSAAYSQALAATGGTPPYIWSIVAGSLPAGLSLSGSTIGGTPTTAGDSEFTVQVTDSTRPTARTSRRELSITINPSSLAISTSTLPQATIGVAYAQDLVATGGTPPYTWSIVSSALPNGLTLNGASIRGTPTTSGSFNFTVRVADNSAPAQSTQKALNITVAPNALTITTAATLPGGILGTAYNSSLSATGGVAPYVWSVSSGALPDGLTLLSSGAITGTTTKNGVFTFTAMVTDSAGGTPASRAFTISVITATLVITTPALSSGIQNSAYLEQLAATGGAPPYTWAVVSGTLPTGLSLNSAGALQGTPSIAGSASITVRVTDSQGTLETRQFTLAVGPPLASLSMTGVPSAVNPAQQLPIGISLSTAHPNALAGTLTMTFQSTAVAPVDDPAAQFSTGSRSVNFTIRANSQTADLPAQLLLLAGTVSGTVTLTASIQNGPAGISLGSTSIRAVAPIFSSITAVRVTGGLRVQITGYSPERRMTNAEFGFDVRTTAGTQRVTLPRDVESDFNTWYRSTGSAAYGSTFFFEQLFTVQGDSSMINSVTVTLRNAQGSTVSAAIPITN